MSQFAEVFRDLDWSVLTDLLLSAIPVLVCFTVHELCHGLTAYMLGDDTAKNMGRITLNPLKHLDVTGLLMLAVFKFGWAKPVPVNPNNFKNYKQGMAVTALAGPASTIVLAALLLALYGVLWRLPGLRGGLVLDIILETAYFSVSNAVFNILPIPPLDGSKVLFGLLLSHENYTKLMRYERYGMTLLVLLTWSDNARWYLFLIADSLFDKLAQIALFIMQFGR